MAAVNFSGRLPCSSGIMTIALGASDGNSALVSASAERIKLAGKRSPGMQYILSVCFISESYKLICNMEA